MDSADVDRFRSWVRDRLADGGIDPLACRSCIAAIWAVRSLPKVAARSAMTSTYAMSLQVGAHAVGLDLARDLLDRGARINACAVSKALDNEDVEVVQLLARAAQPDDALGRLGPRLRMMAAQAALAGRRATAQSDQTVAEREQRRSAVLAELADRFDPDHRP